MKRIASIALLAVFAVAFTVDAGPFRRVFGGRAPQGCPNCPSGQCEVQPAAPLVAAADPLPAEGTPLFRADLDPKSFGGALSGQLAKKGRLTLQEKHLARILNANDSPRRDRQLARMEAHARIHLDMPPTGAVDWAAVDWTTLLQSLLQLLIKLLPLFL